MRAESLCREAWEESLVTAIDDVLRRVALQQEKVDPEIPWIHRWNLDQFRNAEARTLLLPRLAEMVRVAREHLGLHAPETVEYPPGTWCINCGDRWPCRGSKREAAALTAMEKAAEK